MWIRINGLALDLSLIHRLTILLMILRRDITIISISGIFLLAFTATGSLEVAISSIFLQILYMQ